MRFDHTTSPHPLGRKYSHERWEQNLYNAIKQTGYSFLPYKWVGGDEKRNKWLYVPAVILTPHGYLYIDTLTIRGSKTQATKRREVILKELNANYMYVSVGDSQQDMYTKIRMRLAEMKQGK